MRSMCRYISVVEIDVCPSIICMALSGAPPSSKCVAKEWRSVCGDIFFVIPASLARRRTI